MKWAVFSAALSVISSQLTAQSQVNQPPPRPVPQASSSGSLTQYAITVKGCIDDRRLTVSESDAEKLTIEMLRVTEFRLDGPRDVLRLLREHDGHDDEIAGVVSVRPVPPPVIPSVDAKKRGPLQHPRVLVLKVESLTHLRKTCVERH
jgi:hypothetical protein